MSTIEPRRHRLLGFVPLARVAVAVAALAHLFATPAGAHPVSQGKLEIAVSPDRVSVHATVSNEEVLVAAAAVGSGHASPLELRSAHGDYLLGHLHVTADGALLAGKVVARPATLSGRPEYVIEFRLSVPKPARLVFREDVLREFEFAPGVPWEASYVVQVRQGVRPPRGVSLLSFRESLVFACDWSSDLPGPAAAPSHERHRTALTFFRHGVMHILTGYDHLLFVAALLLAARSLWDLVKVVTSFSMAHTLTLAISALDVFRLPEQVVEPMIAASIVFVAVQNIVQPERSRGASRLLAAFLFGLFHGLGFAGGLLEAMSGLNLSDLAGTVAAFSAGVEFGHQTVVLPVFGLLYFLRRSSAGKAGCDRLVERGGSAVISLLGAIYFSLAI
ncbi:MAG: HupE/UreJ family protein [Paludisphaera borealis]|uniref:HupE/UreJ family protein n=1 Tax=Paludisphaera borealis TaxID=1387353 RepID=UPI00284EB422|nr:HupE/UreJ family protein [Paludisphaera borealis]MDR3623290.1 HupE/UreJ family protein [Paludisphaera borealis]